LVSSRRRRVGRTEAVHCTPGVDDASVIGYPGADGGGIARRGSHNHGMRQGSASNSTCGVAREAVSAEREDDGAAEIGGLPLRALREYAHRSQHPRAAVSGALHWNRAPKKRTVAAAAGPRQVGLHTPAQCRSARYVARSRRTLIRARTILSLWSSHERFMIEGGVWYAYVQSNNRYRHGHGYIVHVIYAAWRACKTQDTKA